MTAEKSTSCQQLASSSLQAGHDSSADSLLCCACSSIDKRQGLDVASVTAHYTAKSTEGFKVVSHPQRSLSTYQWHCALAASVHDSMLQPRKAIQMHHWHHWHHWLVPAAEDRTQVVTSRNAAWPDDGLDSSALHPD